MAAPSSQLLSKRPSRLVTSKRSPHMDTLPTCLLFFLVINFASVPYTSATRVAFDLQELTHDTPIFDMQNVNKFTAIKGENVKYLLTLDRPDANNTVRLFLSKPVKVRQAETEGLGELVEIHEGSISDPLPYIKFLKVNAFHRGYYHLYRFEYDASNLLVNYNRIDIEVVVEGLSQEHQKCSKGSDCESTHCMNGRFCLCNADYPVHWNNAKRCLQAKNFNETCLIDEECQEFGGKLAECYRGWNRCRCRSNSVSIKVSTEYRHCVPLAPLNHSCIYSMQCSLAGPNRYCNGKYRCECLPGHTLEHGRFCSSSRQLTSLQAPLLLLFAAGSLIVSFLVYQ